jgi:aryl-alcohol dehydrogenase-like predicted oxidoreductase
MSAAPVEILFGGAYLGKFPPLNTPEYLEEMYSALSKHGVTAIDSSQLYGEREAMLGTTKAGERFAIDTKWMGGVSPG